MNPPNPPSPAAGEPGSGLTLLGHSGNPLPGSPDEARLETFPNRHPNRDYWITLDCPEFTSLCPVTGQPDFAEIQIRYIPDQLCVETKSLKYYLGSFRNRPSFNEDVVNRILNDLAAATAPRQMIVTGKFGSRGGISLSVEARHP